MTVAELIEALRAFPQDMEVYVAGVSEMDGDLLAGEPELAEGYVSSDRHNWSRDDDRHHPVKVILL